METFDLSCCPAKVAKEWIVNCAGGQIMTAVRNNAEIKKKAANTIRQNKMPVAVAKIIRDICEVNISAKDLDKEDMRDCCNAIRNIVFDCQRVRRHPAFDSTEDELLARQKGICPCCHRKIKFGEGEVDHKIPISLGGSDEIENKELLHKECNRVKSTRYFYF